MAKISEILTRASSLNSRSRWLLGSSGKWIGHEVESIDEGKTPFRFDVFTLIYLTKKGAFFFHFCLFVLSLYGVLLAFTSPDCNTEIVCPSTNDGIELLKDSLDSGPLDLFPEILQFLPDRLGSRRRGSGLGPFGIAAKLGPQPEPIHVTARREPTD